MQFTFLPTGQACPPSILKPSSLNYKISLRSAVEEFMKKESKIEDYQLLVEECSLSDDNNETRTLMNLYEDLDDALY